MLCLFNHLTDTWTAPVFCLGFPSGSAVKESTYSAGDQGLIPGLGRFPWRTERLPTPVFWPGEFHGLYSPWGRRESDMTERLSLSVSLLLLHLLLYWGILVGFFFVVVVC